MSAPRSALVLALGLAMAGPLRAGDAELTLESLAARLHALESRQAPGGATPVSTLAELDQRLRALETGAQPVATVAPAAPPAAAAPEASRAAAPIRTSLKAGNGLAISAPDDGLELRLRAVVQGDGRFFLGSDGAGGEDGWLLRRVRPTLEGSWGPLIGFRLTPELAGDSASLVDAYVDLKFDPRATVRLGKFKGPLGLERLQSASVLAFVERGFPNELAPNRDLGVQLQGALADAKVDYAVGVFNGTADGRDAPSNNPDGEFELAGRVFAEPWRGSEGALAGLGFGLAGSVGDKSGAGNAVLPRYRTPGQVQFFGYHAGVLADGRHSRLSPQSYYHHGPFGLMGEYIRSSQELATAAGQPATLDHDAWQLTGRWVLTGEDVGYRGVASPNRPFTTSGAGFGAFELVARVNALEIDPAAFPLFADPVLAAARARSWGLGLNWYLTGNLKLSANYVHTRFDPAPGTAAELEDEDLLLTRAQLSF